jgi:hypothetical protein
MRLRHRPEHKTLHRLGVGKGGLPPLSPEGNVSLTKKSGGKPPFPTPSLCWR